MTVAELITQLQALPQDLPVVLEDAGRTVKVTSASVQTEGWFDPKSGIYHDAVLLS